MPEFAVILPAAGRSSRFGDPSTRKVYADLLGKPVWRRAAELFRGRADVVEVVLAISAEDRAMFGREHASIAGSLGIEVIDGGEERSETIARALSALTSTAEYVAVHDAARPCAEASLIDAVFAAAVAHGAALPGLAVTDTLKRLDAGGKVGATVPRGGLIAVQTPQAFRRDLLERAYARRREVGAVTDDAQLVEAIGVRCQVVEGSWANLKITVGADLARAAAIIRERG